MAHKKGVGSTDNGRDSESKRLGVKLFGGQLATAGNIIIRQRGTRYHAGENVYMGKDHTLHAKIDGKVSFRRRRNDRMYVSIVPTDAVAETVAKVAAPKRKAAPKAAPAAPKAAPVAAAPAPVAEAPAAPVAAAAPAAKPAKAAKIALPSGKKITQDDLKMVEGIGPKIEGLLHAGGIKTWQELADAPEADVQKILDEAGPRYRMHQPATWAKQAQMAANAEWERLEKYQDWLEGGRAPEGQTFEG